VVVTYVKEVRYREGKKKEKRETVRPARDGPLTEESDYVGDRSALARACILAKVTGKESVARKALMRK
jgi:hypothetical protein